MPLLDAETLPPTARPVWRKLLEAPAPTDVNLHAAVDAHLSRLVQAPAPDTALAQRLAAGCHAILDATQGTDDHRLAQAAVAYFALTDDGDDDLTSPSGLADDVAVFNTVATSIGRPDLLLT